MYLDILTSVFNMSEDSIGTVEVLRAGFHTASLRSSRKLPKLMDRKNGRQHQFNVCKTLPANWHASALGVEASLFAGLLELVVEPVTLPKCNRRR